MSLDKRRFIKWALHYLKTGSAVSVDQGYLKAVGVNMARSGVGDIKTT
ncbi:hypothetical protein ES705_13787 [subsurface metagenome]